MFASHEIAGGQKPADEYRVVLLGDSSIWGFRARPRGRRSAPSFTLAGLVTPSGKQMRVFNLGYPTMSLTKDLLMLQRPCATSQT